MANPSLGVNGLSPDGRKSDLNGQKPPNPKNQEKTFTNEMLFAILPCENTFN